MLTFIDVYFLQLYRQYLLILLQSYKTGTITAVTLQL